ncbi:MAG: MarR family transcriptional regulator [Rhodobacteraceae bacterium]|nr:MAG: MarR family transcriptional regulator [Paracoccaceae bacterium]
MQEDDRALLFGVFNEIAIIDQLGRAQLEATLPKGLIAAHFTVLNHLMRVADGRTPVELARAFQLPKTSVTHTVGALAKRGLVDVRPNPNDRRSKCVWLTDAGRKLRNDTITAMAPDFAALVAAIDPQKLLGILPVLRELRAFMDHRRNAEPPRDRPLDATGTAPSG